MKLIFAGTPDFAASALAALIAAGHDIQLVLTQPDRPSGRGMALRASPVKALALASGIRVFQPATLRDADTQEQLRSVGAEAMIVAAYGLILPRPVLAMFPLGAINIHASLLPRWRGAAPIQRAIIAGDSETGVCIMQMEAGLDTGPVLLARAVAIDAQDSAGSLHDKLADLGARLIVEALARHPLPASAQSESGATYANKIEKSEARLDWRSPASYLARQIRAFDPSPGATAVLGGHALKIWRAEIEAVTGTPGRVIAADRHGIVVACGEGALRLCEIQKAGGKRLPVEPFLAGTPVAAGAVFELPS
jgi:methionyl-tRNA formyltransferase